MIATTLEQSKQLLESGIDPQTADMYWTNIVETADEGGYFTKESDDVFHLEIGFDFYSDHVVPAWSLSALIPLLPERIFWKIARVRGHDIEGIFEDLVNYLC